MEGDQRFDTQLIKTELVNCASEESEDDEEVKMKMQKLFGDQVYYASKNLTTQGLHFETCIGIQEIIQVKNTL